MTAEEHVRVVEEITRDLDLLVFTLERAPAADVDALTAERADLRRKLDRLRQRLEDLARRMA